MDQPFLINGGSSPQGYRSSRPGNILSPNPAQSSPVNGHIPNHSLDARAGLPGGNHRSSRTAPGVSERQHLRPDATSFDASSLEHSAPPTYSMDSQEFTQHGHGDQHTRFPHVPTPSSPSFKALGKRRVSALEAPDTPSEYAASLPEPTPPAPDQLGRPKPKHKSKTTKPPVVRTRVMPSRLRRGTTAYGIGSNPIDAMIIEAQQRATEQPPIVDPDAVFAITTDPRGPPVAGPSTGITHRAEEKYFEREEVVEQLCKEAVIQTPEFCLLSEVYQPSSRLRTKTESDGFDSSDVAYERRHRKHEMAEKRQRRREKDKLEHERYKLKERVEQLRMMDPHHFRALLPPSSTDSGPELEHVRDELLKHADDLIRRYDILLPPDPRAANGQRLRLKEWEVRREGNRFIPLTDEAASELAAAGLLDEQSAAEAAAAGILITVTRPGLPLLGGKGSEDYRSGLVQGAASDEEEMVEVEGETTVDGEMEHEEPAGHEEVESSEPTILQPVPENPRSAMPVVDIPRPSSGALRIKLKISRPSTRGSEDNTRPPSEQRSTEQNDGQPAIEEVLPTNPLSPVNLPRDVSPWQARGSPIASRRSNDAPVYPSPAPSTIPLGGTLSTANSGLWTELPDRDVPYEHQSRDTRPAHTPAAISAHTLRKRTPRASTLEPTAIPVLLAAAEREANRVAGGRERKLRTADAFGVRFPKSFEEERDFRLPAGLIEERSMTVDVGDAPY